jgi:hypothetical protein
MKSFQYSHGTVSFRALPYPLPPQVQEALKNSAIALRMHRLAIDTAKTKQAVKATSDIYNMATLDFDQEEELLRTYLGVPVTRPVFHSIAPKLARSTPMQRDN